MLSASNTHPNTLLHIRKINFNESVYSQSRELLWIFMENIGEEIVYILSSVYTKLKSQRSLLVTVFSWEGDSQGFLFKKTHNIFCTSIEHLLARQPFVWATFSLQRSFFLSLVSTWNLPEGSEWMLCFYLQLILFFLFLETG